MKLLIKVVVSLFIGWPLVIIAGIIAIIRYIIEFTWDTSSEFMINIAEWADKQTDKLGD